jgi:hypothetical protein
LFLVSVLTHRGKHYSGLAIARRSHAKQKAPRHQPQRLRHGCFDWR